MISPQISKPLNYDIRIGIVGPCSSGKTTLVNALKGYGLNVRHIAQEHSYVPYMWQHISKPDILIFLDVSFPVSQQRRSLNWKYSDYEEQQKRLVHARQHADLTINTDDLSVEKILDTVLNFLYEKLSSDAH